MGKRTTPQQAPIPPEIEPLSGQRQNGESDAAAIACNDWLRMGSGRSIPQLIEQYQEKSNLIQDFEPPSVSYSTLASWSSRYGWPERARAYDANWEARKNAERDAVLNYGLSLDYERVRKLYRLAAMLEAQIYERGADGVLHNIWLPDVKSIGSGEFAERVDIERFNGALIEQYRKVMEDIAKETGGRVDKRELSGGLSLSWADVVRQAAGDDTESP
jgi:hypothetical protein